MHATVISCRPLRAEIWEVIFSAEGCDHDPQPGQFLHVRLPSKYHVLRRPFGIAGVGENPKTWTIVFKVVGAGTKLLSQAERGSVWDVLGPLGRGFPLPAGGHCLLAGGGLGIPPLRYLAQCLHGQGLPVTTVLGWRSGSEAFWIKEFAQFGEVIPVCEDGSLGWKGNVVERIRLLESPGEILFTCGPRPMLAGLQDWARERKLPGFAALEEHMACGVGACGGCVCKTVSGPARVCADGPVFRLEEVIL